METDKKTFKWKPDIAKRNPRNIFRSIKDFINGTPEILRKAINKITHHKSP